VIALVALAVALGGTSYAAVRLPANSVGTLQLKANAVTSLKVKNRSLGRADVKANLLIPGPQGPAGPPGPPGPAGPAGAAGANGPSDAFSHFLNGPIAVPTTSTTLTSLSIPSGGKYVVFGKAYMTSTTLLTVTCTLVAESDFDQTQTFANTGIGYPLQLNVVHEYAAAGSADFKCSASGAGASANFIKVTAVKVANLANSG
jgi:hypothetical protein